MHFLTGGIGLTVLVRLIVKGLFELKTTNGAPKTLLVAVQKASMSQTEYLNLLERVTLMVATSNPGAEKGLVLTMLSM